MSPQVKQIVVYAIPEKNLKRFHTVNKKMTAEGLTLPGLLSSTTAQVLGEEGRFVDTMVWDSMAVAESSNQAFESLPSAKEFLGCMAGPPERVLFTEHKPDAV